MKTETKTPLFRAAIRKINQDPPLLTFLAQDKQLFLIPLSCLAGTNDFSLKQQKNLRKQDGLVRISLTILLFPNNPTCPVANQATTNLIRRAEYIGNAGHEDDVPHEQTKEAREDSPLRVHPLLVSFASIYTKNKRETLDSKRSRGDTAHGK